jgi:hypothetical protein
VSTQTLIVASANADQYVQQFINELGRKSIRTRRRYHDVAYRFLTECGDFSRQGMSGWINSLGYSDNSIRQVFYILKRLCRTMQVAFPMDKDLLPPTPDEYELRRPVVSFDTLISMIDYWKRYPKDYHASLLFLSSVYGLRSIEMSADAIQPIILHLPDSFEMSVAKRKNRGNKPVIREHLIPQDMSKYLTGFCLKSERQVNYSYNTIAHAISHKRLDHENWHSVRRLLDTVLLEAITKPSQQMLIRRFMRWNRGNNAADMTNTYFNKSFADINREVFPIHPIIPLWE